MFELVERARFSAKFLVIRDASVESGTVPPDFHISDISRDSGKEPVNDDTHYDDMIEFASVSTAGDQSIDSPKRWLCPRTSYNPLHEFVVLKTKTDMSSSDLQMTCEHSCNAFE